MLFLFVRVVFCTAYTLSDPWEQIPVRDEWYSSAGTDGYIQLARTLHTDGRWAYFPEGATVHNRPPAHPLLLALTAAWDADHWYIWWMLTAILLQALAFRFFYRTLHVLQPSAVWRAWLLLAFVLHPYLVGICRASTFVPLAITLLCALVWLAARWQNTHSTDNTDTPLRKLRLPLLMGLVVGLLLLTHGTFAVLLPILMFWLRAQVARMLLVVGVAGLLVLPWTLFNHTAHDSWIPVATGAGIQYWKGQAWLQQQPDLEYQVYQQHTGNPLRQTYFGPDAPADDAFLLRLAWQDIRADVPAYVGTVLQSYLLFWTPDDRNAYKWVATVILQLGLLLALVWVYTQYAVPKSAIVSRRVRTLLLLLVLLLPLPFALLAAITGYFTMLLPLALLLLALPHPRATAA